MRRAATKMLLLVAPPSGGTWVTSRSSHSFVVGFVGCGNQPCRSNTGSEGPSAHDKFIMRRRFRPAMCSGSTAYGEGMSQGDMMDKDMLILVDDADRVSGSMSKRDAHTFNEENPRGRLHRAFSCFLFDSSHRMMLTRRATSKITFPGVWTNACCSHPLHGQVPDEVDRDEAELVKPGIKHAARRKLEHELGISPDQVPLERLRFLSRFRYWAADTLTYGDEPPWGEHEVDYVLLAKLDLSLNPNPDEVAEVRFVTQAQLKEMLADSSLRWSPWFIGIMERAGWEYWDHLNEALQEGSRFVTREIVFFDPPAEHKAKYNLDSHGEETGVVKVQRSSQQPAVPSQ